MLSDALERSSASTLLGSFLVLLVCEVIDVCQKSWARAATIACVLKVVQGREPVRIVKSWRGEGGSSARLGVSTSLLAGLFLRASTGIGQSQ